MTLVTLAKLIKRSAQIYEETCDLKGKHTKQKDEAVRQAVEELKCFNDDEKKHWEDIVWFLITGHLWNDSLSWADRVLAEKVKR